MMSSVFKRLQNFLNSDGFESSESQSVEQSGGDRQQRKRRSTNSSGREITEPARRAMTQVENYRDEKLGGLRDKRSSRRHQSHDPADQDDDADGGAPLLSTQTERGTTEDPQRHYPESASAAIREESPTIEITENGRERGRGTGEQLPEGVGPERQTVPGDWPTPQSDRSEKTIPSGDAYGNIIAPPTDSRHPEPPVPGQQRPREQYSDVVRSQNQGSPRQTKELRQANQVQILRQENIELRRILQKNRQEHGFAIEQLSSEIKQLKVKLGELHNSHVTSVNSVGTGLEPISVQTFKERFRTLHDDVNVWCRKLLPKGNIRPLSELENSDLKYLLQYRLLETHYPTFSQLMDTIAWAFIEIQILDSWFPLLPEVTQRQFSELEHLVTEGDSSTEQEKISYWRAYTKSLLFQRHREREGPENVAELSAQLLDLLTAVRVDRVKSGGYSREQWSAMQDSLVEAQILASELKCQRGVYEMDCNIKAGDPYDDLRMEDATCAEDVGEGAIVSVVLSKGWVKRPFRGAQNVGEIICKARVLVIPQES